MPALFILSWSATNPHPPPEPHYLIMLMITGSTADSLNKTRHHLSHHWAIVDGVPMLSAAPRPRIGGGSITQATDAPHQLPSVYAPCEGPLSAPWLAYDKQVLCFRGYFKETLHEVHRSPFQVRPVKIYFYLEDGTVQVSEMYRENSGLPRGCVVSRQRVPRPVPCQNEFIGILDLNVAQTVTIFSRVYQICDCDRFTRFFLNRAGITVPDPLEVPDDPGLVQRLNTNYPKKPNIHVDTLGQFLRNDRRVLRFDAYWDDRDAEFGDVRDMQLFYYLADDTIHVKERFPRNSGRDESGVFLARGKLPKRWAGMPGLGQQAPYTVLNVLGGGVLLGSRYVTDALNCGDRPIEYYTDRDLTLGGFVNVYGREMRLIDMDKYTREYYRTTYGLEDFTPLPRPRALASVDCHREERQLPVFNGWGSHEDSEGNCRYILPKPPRQDQTKFFQNDGVLLRFGAKLLRSRAPENLTRVFIVTFWMASDKISVYELGVRNSGFGGGDFFRSARFVMPETNMFTAERPKRYEARHMYVGAELELNGFVFGLVSADEFALGYMEQRPEQFRLANVSAIMAKVRDALRPQYKAVVARYACDLHAEEMELKQTMVVASYETLHRMLVELLGERITDHEVITLARHFAAERQRPPECERESVRSVVHSELNRGLWDAVDRLGEHLYHLHGGAAEWMRAATLHSAVMACRMPLAPVLVDNMIRVLHKNKEGEISVQDFLKFVDRIHCHAKPIAPKQLYMDMCTFMPFMHAGRVIDWNCFLDQLGLEEELLKHNSTPPTE